MNRIPQNLKIYHLTHIENLQGIVESCALLSDSKRHQHTNVGISEIKRRRLQELDVRCHPGTKVGEYVPFYFCPRSIMLYLIFKGNHPDLTYTDGQNSIVYLRSDLYKVIEWAQRTGRRWAFSDRNAGARYASFYCDPAQLDKINWEAVVATDFRDPLIKDGKQAEFLIYESFPFELIERIGVYNQQVEVIARRTVEPAYREIMVEPEPEWYF